MGYKPGRKVLSTEYYKDSRIEKTAVVIFKIPQSGADDIKCMANAAGIPVSQYIRDTLTGILSHSFPYRTKELLEKIAEKEGKPANIIVRDMVRRALYYYERKWRGTVKNEDLNKNKVQKISKESSKSEKKGKLVSPKNRNDDMIGGEEISRNLHGIYKKGIAKV